MCFFAVFLSCLCVCFGFLPHMVSNWGIRDIYLTRERDEDSLNFRDAGNFVNIENGKIYLSPVGWYNRVKSLLIKCQKRLVPVLDDWCQSMGAKEEADPDALQNQPVLGIRVPLSSLR